MAERQKLGIDVDDCLLTLIEPFIADYNKIYGTNLVIPSSGSYNIEDTYGPPVEADWTYQIDRFFERELQNPTQVPNDGAVEVVKELAEHSDLVAVTARDKRTEELTRYQIEMHFGKSILDVYLPTPHNGDTMVTDKGLFCLDKGISHLVDDADHNIRSVYRVGVGAVSFGDIYYNRQDLPEEVSRADTWHEVREIFIK